MATPKKKIKVGRIIAIILMAIGGYTVAYNAVTLTYELSRSVIKTVASHNWNPLPKI
jgi:hypothetical protein